MYFLLFQQDLIDDLKYELTGKFERLIVSLMRAPAYHDAKEIHDALKVRSSLLSIWEPLFLSFYGIFNLILCLQGVGTNEKCLIEVLASRNNKQIHEMVAAYKDGKTNSNGGLSQSAAFFLCLCLQPMVATWRRAWSPTHQVTSRRCWWSYFRCAYFLTICISS